MLAARQRSDRMEVGLEVKMKADGVAGKSEVGEDMSNNIHQCLGQMSDADTIGQNGSNERGVGVRTENRGGTKPSANSAIEVTRSVKSGVVLIYC